MLVTLGILGARIGAEVAPGLVSKEVDGLAAPAVAGPSHLTFVMPVGPQYDEITNTRAAAVMCEPASNYRDFVVDDIPIACARLSAWLLPVCAHHEREACGEMFGEATDVHVSASIEPGARIGSRCQIGANTVIGAGANIGDDCHIGANAVISGHTEIAERCSIGSGCSIGEDGFGFVRDGRRWIRVPHFGSVRISADTRIQPQTVVHRGVFSTTHIGRRCALDSHVLIGHDVRIGDDTAIAGHTAVGGGAVIGNECKIGGQVGIADGVYVANGATVTGMSMVAKSLEVPNTRYSSGWPAEPSFRWWRRVVGFTGRMGKR